jgi:hypothetical protein
MTEKWSFSERFPSFHSNLTQKQSEKETPAKEVHFSRPELTERWSPTEYSFSPPRKEQSEDLFGVILDANNTPNSSNLKEKTGNFDISYGRRDRVSFKEPLPSKENVIDSPETPLEPIDMQLVFDLAYGHAQSIADVAHGYKKYRELSKVPLEEITKEENADLRLNLFDFCTFGRTIEEILGTKFAKTFFPNPGSRIETRNAILQRVVNDPYTLDETRKLALSELGKIDHPKLYEENKRYTVSATRNLFLNQEQIERTLQVKEEDLVYFGIVLFGDWEEVAAMTRKCSLWR